MSNDILSAVDASPETREILQQLQSEGHDIAGVSPAEKSESPKETEQTPKPDTEEKTEEKPETQGKEDGDKKESTESLDEANDPKPEEKKVERAAKYVPVTKYNEERHKRQEAERRAQEIDARIKELESIRSTRNEPNNENQDDIKAAAKQLAEKHNLDADFLSELAETLVGVASKRSVIPKELEAEILAIKEARQAAEATAIELKQEEGFSNEFSEIVKEFPDLAERKEELKQLAFSEGNVNTSLRRIALEYIHDNGVGVKGKKSAEAPVNVKKETQVVDFSNMTEDEFKGLSDEQHELYMKWLDKKR